MVRILFGSQPGVFHHTGENLTHHTASMLRLNFTFLMQKYYCLIAIAEEDLTYAL